MKIDPETVKQLVDKRDSLEKEVEQLEQRKNELQKAELLELKQREKDERLALTEEKKHKRALAKKERKEARSDDLREISTLWNNIFGVGYDGRGFIERFGAFAFRYFMTTGICVGLHFFVIPVLLPEHLLNDSYILIGKILTIIIAFCSGVRGWLGYTKLFHRHQRIWGILALIFLGIVILGYANGVDVGQKLKDTLPF